MKASLGVSGLFLSGAASLTSPVENANLLSGVSTFLNGTSSELSQTVLGGKTPDILYRAVMAARAEERERLIALLNNTQFGERAPDIALSQVQGYHGMCGPIVGLNALSAGVEKAQANAAKEGQTKAAITATEILKLR